MSKELQCAHHSMLVSNRTSARTIASPSTGPLRHTICRSGKHALARLTGVYGTRQGLRPPQTLNRLLYSGRFLKATSNAHSICTNADDIEISCLELAGQIPPRERVSIHSGTTFESNG